MVSPGIRTFMPRRDAIITIAVGFNGDFWYMHVAKNTEFDAKPAFVLRTSSPSMPGGLVFFVTSFLNLSPSYPHFKDFPQESPNNLILV